MAHKGSYKWLNYSELKIILLVVRPPGLLSIQQGGSSVIKFLKKCPD